MENHQPIISCTDVFKLGIEQSQEGVSIFNKDGDFTYINPSMALLFGYTIDDLIGQSWKKLFYSVEVKRIETLCLPIVQAKNYWRGNLKGRKKSGEMFDIEVSLTPLVDDSKTIIGLVCRCHDNLDLLKTQLNLLDKNKNYELVFNQSPVLIAHVGSDYCYKITNKKYSEWVGLPQEKLVGKHIKDVLTEAAFENAKPNIDKVLLGEQVNFEARVPHSSGNMKWVNATYIADKDTRGNVIGFFAFIVDINDKKQDENQRQNLMNAIDNGMEGFALHDVDGNFIYVNSAQANMYGYETDELINKHWKQLYSNDEITVIENKYFPTLLEKGHWRGDLHGLKKNGEYFDVEVSLTLIKDEFSNVNGMFCSCRDISERKRTQKEVDFLAFHDSLTKLPNRLSFKNRLEQTLVYAHDRHLKLGLLFIDLDHFKHINDTLGHSVGDELLMSVADRIKSVFRNEDIVARLSGDEFTVLLSDVSNKHSVEVAIHKLLEAFRKPFLIHEHEYSQTISIGVSLYPQDGGDAETLMKHADVAMYRVKEEGRQNYRFYTPGLSENAEENLLYRGQLQKALDNDEFILHYQPIVSLSGEIIIGMEALLRWQHPEKGLIYPDKFINYAEESNLILPIGYKVIEKVCDQIYEWKKYNFDFGRISINVSGKQLQSGFADMVSNILSDKNIDAKLIELEITENFLLRGMQQPVNQLNMLRDLGVNLSIDDFGVGYSSLSQLKQLPFQSLKIDRSFVRDINQNNDDLAIVNSIIALGKTLKLDIIAEGVETKDHHVILESLGCQKAQGYYYSKPQAPMDIPTLCNVLSEKIKMINYAKNQ